MVRWRLIPGTPASDGEPVLLCSGDGVVFGGTADFADGRR